MTSTKTKTGIILIATLIVGMLLGFFLNTIFMMNKFERFNRMRKPGALKEIFYNQIAPSDEQKLQLDIILQKYHEKMEAMREVAHLELTTMKDSLFNKLKPILTDEQFEKLNDGFFRPPFPRFNRGKYRGERQQEFRTGQGRQKEE